MTQLEAVAGTIALSEGEARALTDAAKAGSEEVAAQLLCLYEGGAHVALGYPSWAAFFEAEFGGSDASAYRLLTWARVKGQLPIGSRRPANEAVARELAPLLDDPDELRAAWSEALVAHGGKPAAAAVRPIVQSRLARRRIEPASEDVTFEATSRPPAPAPAEKPSVAARPSHGNGLPRPSAPSADTGEWSTPRALFDRLSALVGGFDLDVCAVPSNAQAERFYSPEDDALAQEWTGTCWMNPPDKAIGRWVAKAWEAAQAPGTVVVCLLPARLDAGWFWDYCQYGEIRFLRRRLDDAAPFPAAVVIFGRPPRMVYDGHMEAERASSVEWWER